MVALLYTAAVRSALHMSVVIEDVIGVVVVLRRHSDLAYLVAGGHPCWRHGGVSFHLVL